MDSSMQVLLIEDDAQDIAHTVGYLNQEAPQVSVIVANSLEEAKARLNSQHFDSVIIDHDPPDGSGVEFVRYLAETRNTTIPIVITEYGNYRLLNDIFRQGVMHHVVKADCYWECLPMLLEQAVSFSRLLAEERAARQATPAELAEKRDSLMSRISHEIKTPLTSILGFAHMLMTKPDAPVEKRQKWANFIHSKTQQLSRLIDNMLDLSDAQAGDMEITKHPASLNAVIGDALVEMEALAPERTIIASMPTDLPEMNLDADRILQVIVNLLTNAHNSTPAGEPIRFAARQSGDNVEIVVTDHGPTLSPEVRQNIFEPFYAEPGSGLHAGKGLWLPLARVIVERHGGRIWLEPAMPNGTSYVLTLPSQ